MIMFLNTTVLSSRIRGGEELIILHIPLHYSRKILMWGRGGLLEFQVGGINNYLYIYPPFQ